MRHTSVGRYTLTICAAGHDRPDLGPVVCGLPPHHPGNPAAEYRYETYDPR